MPGAKVDLVKYDSLSLYSPLTPKQLLADRALRPFSAASAAPNLVRSRVKALLVLTIITSIGGIGRHRW